MAKGPSTSLIIPCRLSYAHIWEKDSNGKYSAALIIDKDENLISKIEKAIEAAKIIGKSKLANSKGAIPKSLKTPLRDADEEEVDDEAYVGKMWINASTSNDDFKRVDRRAQPIIDKTEIYSGCYCNVAINFYAFSVEGNKGIACGLNGIQKVRDGERLSGIDVQFASLDDEDDDDIFS